MIRKFLPIAALLPLAGCALLFGGNSIKGKVDGESVKMKEAIFTTYTDVYENGDDEIFVMITDFADPCTTLAAFYEAFDAAETPEEMIAAYAMLPAELWQAGFSIRVEDAEADLSGAVLTGVAWDELTEDAMETYATINHQLKPVDEAYFESSDPDIDLEYGRAFWSHLGTLEIKKHEAGSVITGKFETELYDANEETSVGEVTISFAADYCAEIE